MNRSKANSPIAGCGAKAERLSTSLQHNPSQKSHKHHKPIRTTCAAGNSNPVPSEMQGTTVRGSTSTSSFEGLIPTSPTMGGTLAPGDGGSPAWSDTAEARDGPVSTVSCSQFGQSGQPSQFRFKRTSLRCLSYSTNFPQETTSGLQDRQCQNRQCGCV